MDLQTYLTKSSSRPNKQILQSLGATEEQIEYIMETPENFNWNVWDGLGSGGGDIGEVWLVGRPQENGEQYMSALRNNGDIDYIAELYANPNNYQVFLNGEEVPYLALSENTIGWSDVEDISEDPTKVTKAVLISKGKTAMAMWHQATPPSEDFIVKVSVKRK